MECSDVREKLAAYLEGIVSAEERLLIGNHLSSCGECRIAMEDLEKAGTLVKALVEVEPPPWLTEKVMAHVREEAKEKGGLLGWLIYPLRVKIPIEAFAMLLVVGLAVYMYRVNAPQFEAAKMAGRTGQMLAQDRLSGLPPNGHHGKAMPAPPSNPPAPAGEGTGTGRVSPGEENVARGPAEAGQGLPLAAAEKARGAEERRAAAEEKSIQGQGAQSGVSEEGPLRQGVPSSQPTYGAPEAREQPHVTPSAQAPTPAFQAEVSPSDRAKAGLSRQGPAAGSGLPAAEAPARAAKGIVEKGIGRLDFTLRVRDVDTAAQEVEKMLGEAGAPRVIRESRDGAESVAGVVKIDRVDGLLRKIRGLGEMGDFTPGTEKGTALAIRVGIVGTVKADEKVVK